MIFCTTDQIAAGLFVLAFPDQFQVEPLITRVEFGFRGLLILCHKVAQLLGDNVSAHIFDVTEGIIIPLICTFLFTQSD